MASRRTPRPSKREQDLRRDIQALEDLAATATANGSYGPAATARAKAASLRTEYHRIRDLRLASGATDPLVAIRHRIALAERDGSWQAVARLQADESSLIASLAEAEAAKAAEEMTEMSAEELVAVIVSAIDEMPLDMVGEIATAIAERLGEEALAGSYALSHPVPAEG